MMLNVPTDPLSRLFPLGLTGRHQRLITAADLVMFARLTGDDDPIHWDEAFCRGTPYGRPIVPAVLLVGFMSAASVQATRRSGVPLVSLGYDRMRFIAPVFAGEETEAIFVVAGHDEPRGRILANVSLRAGERLAAVAQHILKRVG